MDVGARARALTGLKFVSAGLSFVLVATLSRFLGQTGFGQVALSLSVAGLFSVVASYGQHVMLVRALPGAGAKDAARLICGASTKVLCVGGSIGALCILVARFWAPELDWFWLWMTTILAAGFACSELISHAARGVGAHFAAILPRDIYWRIFCIFACLALSFFARLRVEHVYAVLCIGLCAALAVQVWKLYRLIRDLPEPACQSEQPIHNDRALWVGSVSGIFLAHADNLIVGLLFGPASAGGYFVLNRLAQLLGFIAVGEHQSIAPTIARAYRDDGARAVECLSQDASQRMTKLTFAGWALLLIFTHPLLSLLAIDLPGAFRIIFWLGAAAFANAVLGPGDIILNMTGHERAASRVAVMAIALAVVFVGAGGAIAGLVGVAGGVFAATVFRKIMFFRACAQKMGIFPARMPKVMPHIFSGKVRP